MCKLRISAHKLKIEVGHYNKTPRNERFCKKCNTDEIEDEMHFLLLCNHFETDRKNILAEVKNFHTLTCENKLIFLMNNENISIHVLTVPLSVGKFIKDNLY
jgi:hypothetical protein